MAQIVEYNVTDAAIEEMKNRYMALTVSGLDDKKGFSEVHEARMVVRGKRIEVEKKRKELKADALKWGQKVDAEARRITKLLEPIEEHLTIEEEKITKEKERIKAEEERRRNEIAQDRVNQMAKFGKVFPFSEAISMSEGDFFAKITIAKAEYETEQARIAEEKRIEAERRAFEKKARDEEAARLAAERAEIERMRAEESAKRKAEQDRLAAERAKIEAERKAVENARREQERIIELERAKKEAAERAVKEAAEKAAREAKERAEAERLAKEEEARQESIRPDKEKLLAYARAVISIASPEFSNEQARAIFSEVQKRLLAVNRYIVKSAQDR